MSKVYTCQLVGSSLIQSRAKTSKYRPDEFERPDVAKEFALDMLREKIKQAFGDKMQVLIDDVLFDVGFIVSADCVRARRVKKSFPCEFRDDDSIRDVYEGEEPSDVVKDFIRKHWKQRHGLELFVRVGDEFFKASVSPWGVDVVRITAVTYEANRKVTST